MAYSEESTWSRRDGFFGGGCCLLVVATSSILTISSCPLTPMMKAADLRNGNDRALSSSDLPGMSREESLPRLGRRLKCFDSIFGNCRFSYLETEQVEFGF
jgi:hypothetical protein